MPVDPGGFEGAQYARFQALLSQRWQIMLPPGKGYLLRNRLNRCMQQLDLPHLDALCDRLEAQPDGDVASSVLLALLQQEQIWFLDDYPFTLLVQVILPEWIASSHNGRGLRIGSLGCGTGQEPYSISLALEEYRIQHPDLEVLDKTKIVATDVSSDALAIAESGVYDDLAVVRGLAHHRLLSFFQATDGGCMRIAEPIRKRVHFQQHAVLEDFRPLGQFDVIYCRNVLMYYTQDVQRKLLGRLSKALHPGGYLFLGSGENPEHIEQYFERMRCNPGSMYRVKEQEHFSSFLDA